MVNNDSAHLVLMQCDVCPQTLKVSWKNLLSEWNATVQFHNKQLIVVLTMNRNTL